MRQIIKNNNGPINKKIKILFIIDQLVSGAGTEKHLLQLASGLNARGHKCKIVTFLASDKMIQKYKSHHLDIKEIKVDRIYDLNAFIRAFKLIKMIRRFKPDVIQCFHFQSDTYGAILSKIANCHAKIISSKRDMGDLKTKRQLLMNRCANWIINRNIAVCNKVAERVSTDEKIALSKITTIYNGIDLKECGCIDSCKEDIRNSVNLNGNDFVIGIVCLLRPEKDVSTFLKAVKGIKDKVGNLKVLVVGDGPDRSNLERYAKNNGMEDNVIFTGYVKRVNEYIALMDIVCLTPKSNEGMSNVIIEEMALNKPVIATDVGGNAELVLDGKTGFIIQPKDTKSLEKYLLKLYQDEALRMKMGAAAKERIENEFRLEHMINKTEAFYRDCIVV